MSAGRGARGWLALVLLVVATGCGGGSKSAPSRAATTPDSTAAVDSAFDELPAALRGPAIGAHDSLMTTLAGPLREWVQLWKAARPEFELDTLRFAGWSAFHAQPDAEPWPVPDTLDADEEGLNALVLGSPGGRYRLLIDRYQSVTVDGEIGGEPDAAPVLLDRRTGRTSTFEFCGTMCGFHWATWIDSTRFVLGGWGEADSRTQQSYGTLDYYDLRKGVGARYLVPPYTNEEYDRYAAAWQDWVMARLRRFRSRPRA